MENITNRAFTTSEEADISCFDWLEGGTSLEYEETYAAMRWNDRLVTLYAIGDNHYLVSAYPEGLLTSVENLHTALETARDFLIEGDGLRPTQPY